MISTTDKMNQQLIAERSQLHQQALQLEQWATIGRLTASFAHEINNPMQAIRGALSLALEELNDPESLTEYLQLCLSESERVVQLVNHMRQIYRPSNNAPEMVALNKLLEDAVFIARKELSRQRVILQVDLSPLPPLKAIANQLQLVFLNAILNLATVISSAGGGKLLLRSYSNSQTVTVEFSTELRSSTIFEQKEPSIELSSSFSRDVIAAHGGCIDFCKQGKQIIFCLKLPL